MVTLADVGVYLTAQHISFLKLQPSVATFP